MSTDTWRIIPGFDGKYQVSNKGVVRNSKTGRILKQSINNGYYQVCLWRASKTSTKSVHSLVAMSFFESRPVDYQGYPFVVNHKDGDKLNNSVENLEYISTWNNTRYIPPQIKTKPTATNLKPGR